MSGSCPTASEFAVSGYDPLVESCFFGRIVLANGSFKTTNTHRLDDLNLTVLPYVRAIQEKPVEIMDVATSSGISAQEWYDDLLAAGIEAQMIGTDLNIEVLHLPGRLADVLLDKHLNVIHLSLLGGAIHPRILKALRASGLNAAARFAVTMGAKAQPMRLVSRAVRNVTLLEDDFETDDQKFDGYFHVIRAANVLNPKYFGAERLRHMAFSLVRRLRPGGLLIVCRTHRDGTNHATIFQFAHSRLQILERVGDGSELEGILS